MKFVFIYCLSITIIKTRKFSPKLKTKADNLYWGFLPIAKKYFSIFHPDQKFLCPEISPVQHDRARLHHPQLVLLLTQSVPGSSLIRLIRVKKHPPQPLVALSVSRTQVSSSQPWEPSEDHIYQERWWLWVTVWTLVWNLTCLLLY